jgi:hypothetical protein
MFTTSEEPSNAIKKFSIGMKARLLDGRECTVLQLRPPHLMVATSDGTSILVHQDVAGAARERSLMMYEVGETLIWTRVTENNVAKFRCVVLEVTPTYCRVQFLDRWGNPQPDDIRAVYIVQLSRDHDITPPALKIGTTGNNPHTPGIAAHGR